MRTRRFGVTNFQARGCPTSSSTTGIPGTIQAPGREPSHPEFDSGTAGFLQLLELVESRGYVPVPMGMPPEATSYVKGPNLIEYWRWPSCQTPRQAQQASD